MSKSVAVQCGDRWFWAYDVSLAILLLEAAGVAGPEPRAMETFAGPIALGANSLLDLTGNGYALGLIEEAGRRLRARGVFSRAEANERYVFEGEPYELRHEQHIDGAVLADLAEAIGQLVRDELPPPPDADRHWFFGVEGGPRTL
ncbi:hypothetical protein [Actinoplanes sp. GCM10030250]|uniref:hypothetical protein n=1 Tax=Actinoplanes sp. GCM10030250 TaxID=3273376 RepID=UPI003612FF8D